MSKPTLPQWLTVSKASSFPTGWCALADDLAVRVAKDLKQFRPTAVNVFVAKSRKRMVIRVFSTRLPPEVESAASEMSPREVKIRLQASIGVAVMSGRKSILGEDWIGVGDQRPRRRMGFV